MTATATFTAELAPIIPLQPTMVADLEIEKPAAQPMSKEVVKACVVSLIKENDTDFIAFLADLLAKTDTPVVSKKEKKTTSNGHYTPKERIPYSEMPFWKANPHLKPANSEGFETKQGFYEALMAFATNPETRLTDDMIDDLD
jgi:hypothetical protein